MKSLTSLITLLALTLIASPNQAADLVLRQQATQQGSIVRLGDIADISASSATEMKALASTPLLPAPAKGTKQYLSVAQIRELLIARGIQLDALTIHGATTVEIGSVVSVQPRTSSPQPVAGLTLQQATQNVKQTIEHKLQSMPKPSQWRVEVTLSKHQLEKIKSLGTKFEARELQKLRSGRQRFALHDSNGEKKLTILADLTRIQSVVVVRNPIERGQLVRASDLEIRQREGNLPSGSLTEMQPAIGKVATRGLRADEVLLQNSLRAPWQVRRGETVNIYVRTGGIVVRTRGLAKENGAMGELIMIETLEGKQRLDVSVSGPGEVTVYATGGRATDYASLDRDRSRNDQQRR